MNRVRERLQPLLVLMAVGSVLLSASGDVASPSGKEKRGQVVPVDARSSYSDLTPGELSSMLDQQDPFFVNVHIPYEGEIPHTDAFVPYNEIERNAEVFPADLNSTVVVYCRSGSMSAIAAEELTRMGYSNIYNLDGGFRAWEEAGYPFGSP